MKRDVLKLLDDLESIDEFLIGESVIITSNIARIKYHLSNEFRLSILIKDDQYELSGDLTAPKTYDSVQALSKGLKRRILEVDELSAELNELKKNKEKESLKNMFKIPEMEGQIWEPCHCGTEPVYTPLMLCEKHWPK